MRPWREVFANMSVFRNPTISGVTFALMGRWLSLLPGITSGRLANPGLPLTSIDEEALELMIKVTLPDEDWSRDAIRSPLLVMERLLVVQSIVGSVMETCGNEYRVVWGFMAINESTRVNHIVPMPKSVRLVSPRFTIYIPVCKWDMTCDYISGVWEGCFPLTCMLLNDSHNRIMESLTVTTL